MKTSSIVLCAVALLILVIWVPCSLFQIQTNEAFFFSSTATISFRPHWDVLMQPVAFYQGTLSPVMAEGALVGWIISVFSLLFMVGYEIGHEAVRSANKHASLFYHAVVTGAFLFNFYTDYAYSPVLGLWRQGGFAIFNAAMVSFGWIIAIKCIERAIAKPVTSGAHRP